MTTPQPDPHLGASAPVAVASSEDVETRLGRDLTESEAQRVIGLIEEAQVIISGYLGAIPDPVPPAVRVVVSRMVARVLEQPDSEAFYAESVSHSAGPFSETKRYSSGASGGAPWLTASDKQALAAVRRRGRGIYTLKMG